MKSKYFQIVIWYFRLATSITAVLLLASCTTFTPDGGFGDIQSAARERGVKQELRWLKSRSDVDDARTATRQLLVAPLTADGAVQVALLNNRGLQAVYAELGIAEADLVQAGRLRNPGFSLGRLERGGDLEIDRTFLFDVLGLVTMPIRTDLERRRFDLARTRVTAAVLQVAADTRRAWVRAVAAQESVRYSVQVNDAAEAGAELARRMAAAGNFSRLDHAREQVFQADAAAQLARARQLALAERERLIRLVGLQGEDIPFTLPDRLPDLPKAPDEFTDIEARAIAQRMDVHGAMKEAEGVAASLGLTRATGFVDVIELGYQRNSETGLPRQSGYQIELRLPLFDWGGARVARAESVYLQSVNRAADISVRARSEVRESYGAYRAAFDLARRYRDEIVPLRKRISEENVLRYNGMLVSVFELLADAREQVSAVNAYLSALRDYWLAEAGLQLAMTGVSPGTVVPASAAQGAGPAAGH